MYRGFVNSITDTSLFFSHNKHFSTYILVYILALSSIESEYRVITQTITKIVRFKFLIQDLHVSILGNEAIWCDNQSATTLASNADFHDKTKHIETDIHYTWESKWPKKLSIQFVPSLLDIIDVSTKSFAIS